jgi:hypothetical protein
VSVDFQYCSTGSKVSSPEGLFGRPPPQDEVASDVPLMSRRSRLFRKVVRCVHGNEVGTGTRC